MALTNIYDRDSHHVWNRLHAGIFGRVGPDQLIYGLDEPHPLLWSNTKYLLDGGSGKALALLDEFVKNDGPDKIKNPVKRAVMQSDLWAVFDWLADKNAFQTSAYVTKTNEALTQKIAQVIASLRASSDDLKRLPDTYSDAVASGVYATQYDPQNPFKPWLPPDLLEENGSWVNVGSRSNLLGEAHTAFTSGRSVFLILIRLPDGRASTLAYLKSLNNFPHPWVVDTTYTGPESEAGPLHLNPNLPNFPFGTQLALVRRMVVVGEDNRLHPTNVVQSVQFRVFVSEDTDTQEHEQSGFEFRLSRDSLFNDNSEGVLKAVSTSDRNWHLFLGHGIDPFETASVTFETLPDRTIVQSCRACHSPGLMGVQSYTRMFTGARASAPVFSPQSIETIEQRTIAWKQRQYDWGLLSGLMRE